MLTKDMILSMLNKYGYSSKQVHPYVYSNNDKVGICYSFIDEKYGTLERVVRFENESDLEAFVKMFKWYQENGKENRVSLVLSDYEEIDPVVSFVRDGVTLTEEELLDLSGYEEQKNKNELKTEVDKYLEVVKDILVLYDKVKDNIEDFFAHTNNLVKGIRQAYINLQCLIDTYNNYTDERTTPELELRFYDSGISLDLSNVVKDKLNVYRVNTPTIEEVKDFVYEAVDLVKNTELNDRYYNLMKTEYDLQTEYDLLKEKLDYLEPIVNGNKHLFSSVPNVYRKFKKMDKKYIKEYKSFDEQIPVNLKKRVEEKYSYVNQVDILSIGKYLTKAFVDENANYKDIANNIEKIADISLEEEKLYATFIDVLTNLNISYQKLTDEQKNCLNLLNTKYYNLIRLILKVDNYQEIKVEDLISELEKNFGYSELKSLCYDKGKEIIEDFNNVLHRNTVFSKFDLDSYEEFITSLITVISVISSVNVKIFENTKGYFLSSNADNLVKDRLIKVSSNVNDFITGVHNENSKIIVIDIDKGVKVLYSPKTIIIPYEEAEKKIKYKPSINENIVIDLNNNVVENLGHEKIVSRYYSNILNLGDYEMVNELNLVQKNSFVDVIIKKGEENEELETSVKQDS